MAGNETMDPPVTAAPAMVADDAEADNDSAIGDDAFSETTSLSQSIMDYRTENGRTYHSYKDGKYHFPNDDMENERLDLQHHIWALTLDGNLALAPCAAKDAKCGRVLDLGCGTGIWSIDLGDDHPEAEVIGLDLSPTQPSFVPPNVRFQVDDFEDEWTFREPFDYIFSRMNNSSVSNWEKYVQRSFENLCPGGYFEVQDFHLPHSDDGTLKPDMPLQRSMNLLEEAAAKLDHAFFPLNDIKPLMEKAGFVNVSVTHSKWASNSWPKDPKFKDIGTWNCININTGIAGFLMAALTRALGWTQEEVEVLAAQTRLDLKNKSIHAYWPVIIVVGQKPE